jgi:hypothetical protein
MSSKPKQIAVAAALAVAAIGGAHALPAASTAFVSGVTNNISDDFIEILIDRDGNGKITKGDIIFSALGITSFPTSGVAANTVNELTVLAAIQVKSDPITTVPQTPCGNTPLGDCKFFEFTAPDIGLGAVLSVVANGAFGVDLTSLYSNLAGLTFTSDSVALVLEDNNHDFTTQGTLAGSFSSASDGAARMVLDLTAANGDKWEATGPEFLGDFLANGVGIGIGSFGLDLTISGQAFAGWNLGPQFTGRGNLSRAEGTAASPAGGDASFFFEANRVPEPASMALAGIALLACGLASKRKRQAA